MTANFLLDAWALLAYLKKESPADKQVLALLEKAKQGKARLSICIINLGEVYYRAGKERGEMMADEILRLIQDLPIEILPADNPLVLAAARWKMKYPISYADAFAAAAADKLKATLVTGDPELLALKGLVKIEALQRG